MTSPERLILLTGASRGLGHAMALQLLAHPGTTLVCISRRSDAALAQAAQQAGSTLEQWELDLSEPAAAAERLGAW
ncbi:MAG: SDR family NAD(P)-dependent oxidoreductase, partial [Comamonadaceae bacterium]